MAWLAVSAILGAGTTACQDDFDAPAPVVPVAQNKPNTTIFELKQTFWQDATNYIYGMEDKEDAPMVAVPAKSDGSHYIISGRVISSDEQSNVFKSLIIQDETAALAISINSYNLYLNYRIGQEIVLDVTGMYIGKYNGLLQLGYPSWYSSGRVWEASFMAPEFFRSHVELNGLPEASKVDTLVFNSFSELGTTPDDLMRLQSQIVRFNNVEFVNGGKETFSEYHSSGVNQSLTDASGTSLIVRTSGYSTFWNTTLPEGRGDVVCILSYYGTTGWQLILNDIEGCMNFGNPTIGKGAEENPWTVDEAIIVEEGATTSTGWVTGYIVGAVAPEVTSVQTNDDVEWTAEPIMNNTLVIGQTPDTKDISHALVIELPDGSKLRQLGNLVDNPSNYGKQIWVRGSLAPVMDTYGITGNNGATSNWRIEGVTSSDETISNGDGSEASPYSAQQVISSAASGTAWVKGYIVGSSNGMSASDFTPGVTDASGTNIFIAMTPDETNYTNTVPVQLPTGDVRTALNLQSHPENLGKIVSLYGSIEKYFGQMGVKSVTQYTLSGSGSDTPTPDNPTVVASIDENFDASTNIPSGWTQVQVSGNKSWYIPTFNGNNYAAMTGYKGTAPFDQWLFTPGVDLSQASSKVLSFETQVNGYGSTTSALEVYVLDAPNPNTATLKTKLSVALPTAPASGYSDWLSSGNIDLSAYNGVVFIGFRYVATQDDNYATWCVDNVKLNASGSTPTPDPTPDPTPSGDYKGDFNTFNNGEAKASPYGTYTNATGWTATNSIILGGTDGDDSNPYFKFIGAKGTLAPTLNGCTTKVGKLVSPTLTGGIGTLTFNYGFAFSDTKCSFKVTVKDANGAVLKTDTVELTSITKFEVYNYSLAVNATGSFTIEIENLCVSQSTSNKDRVSIWNLTWTN